MKMHKIPIVLCTTVGSKGGKNVSSSVSLWETEHLFALEFERNSPHGFPLKQISKELVNKLSSGLSCSHEQELNVL